MLKTELSCKMSPVVMSASYRRTYLANSTACKGSFKSDKQLINAGLIILSLGFFADFVEVLCIAKRQQRFSVLLGKDFHNASVHSFTLNNIFDHLRLPYLYLHKVLKKIRSGTFRCLSASNCIRHRAKKDFRHQEMDSLVLWSMQHAFTTLNNLWEQKS